MQTYNNMSFFLRVGFTFPIKLVNSIFLYLTFVCKRNKIFRAFEMRFRNLYEKPTEKYHFLFCFLLFCFLKLYKLSLKNEFNQEILAGNKIILNFFRDLFSSFNWNAISYSTKFNFSMKSDQQLIWNYINYFFFCCGCFVFYLMISNTFGPFVEIESISKIGLPPILIFLTMLLQLNRKTTDNGKISRWWDENGLAT